MLGLGNNLKKGGLTTPGIITDSLVLKHKYDAGSVAPVSDGAAYFDGTDDYIDLGSKANSGVDVSVTAWVKLTVSLVAPVIIFGDFMVRFQDATDLRVWGDISGTSSNVTVESVLDKWTHIAVSSDNGVNSVYVNGALIEVETDTASSTDARASYIGRYSSDYFEGYICNVGLWSSTLTQAQIKSIMWKNYAGLTTGTGSESENLVSWWNLDSSYIVGDVTHKTADSHGWNHGTLS